MIHLIALVFLLPGYTSYNFLWRRGALPCMGLQYRRIVIADAKVTERKLIKKLLTFRNTFSEIHYKNQLNQKEPTLFFMSQDFRAFNENFSLGCCLLKKARDFTTHHQKCLHFLSSTIKYQLQHSFCTKIGKRGLRDFEF